MKNFPEYLKAARRFKECGSSTGAWPMGIGQFSGEEGRGALKERGAVRIGAVPSVAAKGNRQPLRAVLHPAKQKDGQQNEAQRHKQMMTRRRDSQQKHQKTNDGHHPCRNTKPSPLSGHAHFAQYIGHLPELPAPEPTPTGVTSKEEMRFAAEIPVIFSGVAPRPGVTPSRHDFA